MNHSTQNEYSKAEENNAVLLKRLFLYQKERFPLLGNGILVASFSFSAISYSIICRGASGFVDAKTFLFGIFTTITLFMLVRIFDEFKDAEDDAMFRKNLPVPRGLVSLRELRIIGFGLVFMQISLHLLFAPKMLMLYLIVLAYLSLMGKEFFVAEWLKKHQFWYVVSHMFIIPLIDIYASGLDWFLTGADASAGLLFFFAVSYMNGIVLEIGRKIRTPDQEQAGVLTYTSLLGPDRAVYLWIGVLFVTFILSLAASLYAGYGSLALSILAGVFVLCCSPALLFLKNATVKRSKAIEACSGLWTIAMYLTLGGVPMVQKILLS